MVSVIVGWISYNLDVNNTPCKQINISNWRLDCVMDINGEEVSSDAIILKNSLKITWTTNLNTNLAMFISTNGESMTYNINNVAFSIYSNYAYKIDWYSANELSTKTDFQDKLKSELNKLSILKNNYIKKDELSWLPLDQNNKYCDMDTNTNCKPTYVQFLKKDPITGKINLDLLINYSE